MVRKIKNGLNAEQIRYNKFIGRVKRQAKIKECLWGEDCSEKIVKAHSIQENGILSKISDNGKVYCFQPKVENGTLSHDFKREGKGKFSTFTGFCGKHDKDIFQPIEDKEFEGSKEQFYLFAFRSISKEYQLQKETINSLDILKERLRIGHPKFIFLEERKRMASKIYKGIEKIFLRMKKQIKDENYDDYQTKYICLDKEYPIVASSCFIPYYDFEGNPIFKGQNYDDVTSGEKMPLLILNIFPKCGKTHILLSYFKDKNTEIAYFHKHLNNRIKEKVSHLLIHYVENMAFSPSYIQENFSEEEKKSITENMQSNAMDPLKGQGKVPNLFKD